MTAVLLTILKIIGIVLLVILGIMLFLLAVLLFVPVRYSVKGTVDNNITAEGKISWLCSIFRYDFTFQEQDLNGEVRIFGFRPKKKERVSEEELEEEAVPEVKDEVEEVVSDLVSNTVEEDDSEGKISKSVIESDSDKISPEEAAGSDARMNGCELPVVINSGSGNQGITTSVPVIIYAKELGVSKEKLYL